MVRRPVSHACDARALEYVIRWQQVSMAEVVTQQSAAVRRLAALMQRDDDAKPHTVLPGTEGPGLAAVDRVGPGTGDQAAGGDRGGPRTVDRQGC